MITMQSWMFLGSFEKLRLEIQNHTVINMLHLGSRAFDAISGEVVQTAAFTIRKNKAFSHKGLYCRLIDPISEKGKEELFLSGESQYFVKQIDFKRIAGCPIAYWLSEKEFCIFDNPIIKTVGVARNGMTTGDNERFLRCWFEVNYNKCFMDATDNKSAIDSGAKWFPYNKGGENRKWYGNYDYLINWENNGSEIRAFKKSILRNQSYYFKECITWSLTATSGFKVRYRTNGSLFDVNGMSLFPTNDLYYLLGLLNSTIANTVMNVINPTIANQSGDVEKIPIIFDREKESVIVQNAQSSVKIVAKDWDSFETSWSFSEHPLVRWSKELWDATAIGATMQYYYGYHPKVNSPLELCYMLWQGECDERFKRLQNNEEELNRIFISIYGLQDELSPEVEDKDVSVRKADVKRDIKSFISYAIGCMFGRYSLDVDGLAFAGGDWDESKYKSFIPDADNIIPITDEKYLPDDLAERFFEWVSVVFGVETLNENLQYIADALGGKGNSREIIRNYLLNEFFKDHCSTYSVTGSGKRPIYWLFDSGKKNGFKALIYMHRYTPDTIGRVRINYLHKIQEKYENEVRAIETFIDTSKDQKLISREQKRMEKLLRQIEEVKAYDEKLEHLAAEQIEIDLDDGVKKNYEKVQTDRNGKKYQILAPIK